MFTCEEHSAQFKPKKASKKKMVAAQSSEEDMSYEGEESEYESE